MKKIAIIGAILALSTSAFAEENAFYMKAAAFGTIGHKIFEDTKALNTGYTMTSDLNTFGDFTFGGTLAAGYQIMDNVRVELQGSYFAGPKFKYDFALVKGVPATVAPAPVVAAISAVAHNVQEYEVSAPAGFLNAYVDLIDMGPAKLYVGGGAGISYMTVFYLR